MTPDEIMMAMAETFKSRNTIYGDNYKNVGYVMHALFPNGIELNTAESYETFHLFELIVVKLTRFANSGLKHMDSIHDSGVYSAMIESILFERESRRKRDETNRKIMNCAKEYIDTQMRD